MALPNETVIEKKHFTPPIYNITREETDKGDIAKSLQQLVETHFVSKRFKDIMGSTRFTKQEIIIMSLLEIERNMSKILSLSEADVSLTVLNKMPLSERNELLELWEIRKRFYRNPHTFNFVIYESFMNMFGLGLQSLDGGSRSEGVAMVGGTYQKIMNPDDMGALEKIKRRLMGNVIFTDEK